MNKMPSEINIDEVVRLVMNDLARGNTAETSMTSAQIVSSDKKTSEAKQSSVGNSSCHSGEVLAALCQCQNEKSNPAAICKRSQHLMTDTPDTNRESKEISENKAEDLAGGKGVQEDQNILTVQDKLISVQLIENRDDHCRKIWRVPLRAIITPLAKDEFRKRGITVLNDDQSLGTFADKAESKSGSKTNSSKIITTKSIFGPKPEAALTASTAAGNSLSRSVRPLIFALHDISINPFLKGLTERLQKRSLLTFFQKSCILETTSALAFELQNTEKSALLLTNYPSLALMLANRRKEIRAIYGRSVEELKKELKLTGPNLLIIDPSQCGSWQIQQMTDWFLEKGPFTPAAFIQKALDQNE